MQYSETKFGSFRWSKKLVMLCIKGHAMVGWTHLRPHKKVFWEQNNKALPDKTVCICYLFRNSKERHFMTIMEICCLYLILDPSSLHSIQCLFLNNLVYELIYETTWPVGKIGCFVSACTLMIGNRVNGCGY